MVLKQLVNAFLPLASCQLLPGLLAATYLHTALTGCAVSRRPAFLLQQPPPSPLSSLFSSHSVSFPHNCNIRFLSQISKYVPDERIGSVVNYSICQLYTY